VIVSLEGATYISRDSGQPPAGPHTVTSKAPKITVSLRVFTNLF
jgi:hypothetical protein